MKITIKNFAIHTFVGIYDYEKVKKVKLLISVQIKVKGNSFDANNVVDYDKVIAMLNSIPMAKHYDYIEELSYSLLASIKELHTGIENVIVRVQKCIFGNLLEEISVEVDG
ncbi:MAG: dihydroneopterin aldolase [Candidatus Deianiraeaceae bacterium]|jgi:dihydroneopterin aldolase